MGDHLALLVDRLLTESTLEAAIASRKQAQIGPVSASLEDPGSELAQEIIVADKTSLQKLVECRICQEEDVDSNMEIPCACCGSLKYAHRKCVQRWCNEKGDIICEICLQQFKPGYTAPPPLFHYGSIPMNFRGSWEISRQDLHDSEIITMVPSDRGLMGSDYDEHSAASTRSAIYCRLVTITFMVLLVLRHTLPLIISGAEQYSFTLFSLLMLRTAGILLPVFVVARALTTFHRRRRVTRDIPVSTFDGERVQSHSLQSQPHLIRVH
ncbi:uncharacterized protein LOC103719010 isoform X2 [Phoenix dactylifera]|uniref:Uncharacterized protein LOC103719010 isoform X2 n=1 Tax=Phoenix dactylifera TaxID=42345 RepID=A0A8B7CTW2_PHODC|nr:uncharacterized protein LOC103719010 isoform X2 [Phoenix dactylifera]